MEIGIIKFKIIVTIFIIALLLPIIMIIIEEIKVSIAINNTKDILSNINAKEMQEEIIDRLKDSKINVNTSSIKTEIEAFQEADEDIIKACTYSSNNDSEKDFVYAFIIDEKEENVVAIPLFRIESDSNGYFKNIEYVSNWFYNINILEKINDVLKTNYGLEKGMGYYGRRYEKTYYGPWHKPSVMGDDKYIQYKDSDFAEEIAKEITDNRYDERYYSNIIKDSEKSVIWGLLD